MRVEVKEKKPLKRPIESVTLVLTETEAKALNAALWRTSIADFDEYKGDYAVIMDLSDRLDNAGLTHALDAEA